MILSVSGRTDIVAFYTEWFMNRYHAGFLDVRNPYFPKQVSRISFNDVDAILFCTKNPLPILNRLKEIKKPILFHVTLTPYKKDIEPNLPDKETIIESIKKTSEIVGIDNIYIRYDPVLINDKYSVEYHIRAFEKVCKLLNGYVKQIIISFIDDYKNVRKNKEVLSYQQFSNVDYERIGKSFANCAFENGMTVQTCFEEVKLLEYGFINQECITKSLASRITGKKTFKTWSARKCKCVEMVDVGVYNTCAHFCKYCYANFDEEKVVANMKQHNKQSSLLIGELEEDDIIKPRK